MSAISKPMAHSTSSSSGYNLVPVEQVMDMTVLTTPPIANYPATYALVFTMVNGTAKKVTYATAALLASAQAAYRTAFSTNF